MFYDYIYIKGVGEVNPPFRGDLSRKKEDILPKIVKTFPGPTCKKLNCKKKNHIGLAATATDL